VTFDAKYFINRELSWLEFNQRVLDEAFDSTNPLLERLKFFCIVASNLDEFFEVRIAGVKQQIESGAGEPTPDGLAPSEIFRATVKRIRRMVISQYGCWQHELRPALAKNGIRLLNTADLDPADRDWVDQFYRTQLRPILTPLSIDPAHPFPQLLNKSLNLIVKLEMPRGEEMLKYTAVVQIPRNCPRLVRLPRSDSRRDYVPLGRLSDHTQQRAVH
jgi:polyphosphate kinase